MQLRFRQWTPTAYVSVVLLLLALGCFTESASAHAQGAPDDHIFDLVVHDLKRYEFGGTIVNTIYVGVGSKQDGVEITRRDQLQGVRIEPPWVKKWDIVYQRDGDDYWMIALTIPQSPNEVGTLQKPMEILGLSNRTAYRYAGPHQSAVVTTNATRGPWQVGVPHLNDILGDDLGDNWHRRRLLAASEAKVQTTNWTWSPATAGSVVVLNFCTARGVRPSEIQETVVYRSALGLRNGSGIVVPLCVEFGSDGRWRNRIAYRWRNPTPQSRAFEIASVAFTASSETSKNLGEGVVTSSTEVQVKPGTLRLGQEARDIVPKLPRDTEIIEVPGNQPKPVWVGPLKGAKVRGLTATVFTVLSLVLLVVTSVVGARSMRHAREVQ